MAREELDVLLTRMSAIAEAVNAFNSEAVQHEAFSALMTAFEGKNHSARQQHTRAMEPEPPTNMPAAEKPARAKRANSSQAKKRIARDPRSEWKMIKDLDLNPMEQQSFGDFISEKKPRSNEDKYPAVIYYLSEVLELPKVNINHIGSVFRLMKWKEPSDLAAGLRVTASRKGTIDTSALDDVKITPAGRNLIIHELPEGKAKK